MLRLMLNTSASEPETMTSFSASLGTLTYSVSPGLASEGLKVMRLTVLSAFMAPRTFSECEGSRVGGTAMVYICVFRFYNFKTYVYRPNMAEGGYDPTDPTTEKTPLIPDTGDDDDDDTNPWDNLDQIPIPEEDRNEWGPPLSDTDSTQPFEPGASSTPSGGEQVPMATRTKLPQAKGPHIAETSFIEGNTDGKTMIERAAWREVKQEFELADPKTLKARYFEIPRAGGGGGAVIEVAMRGKDKWYRLYTLSKGDAEKTFNESLPKQIKTALGKSIDELVNVTNADLQANQNELAAKEKQLEQAEQRAAEVQKLRRDMDALTNGIRDVEARRRELEDKRIIEDENTSPSEKAAAQDRVANNEAELARGKTEVAVRERQRPMLERVKDIFKKYGWTLQAVALAVGVVLRALALAGLNGLKAGTKAVGQGLKAVGQKLGSLLPGLIGSIVGFIFRAAGQVFSFPAKNAWLLILAVVAFFMERFLKK